VAQPSNNLKDQEAVPYHKRIAMGAALDGTSLKSKGSTPPAKKGAPAPLARKNK
jgi:hypothetical protein